MTAVVLPEPPYYAVIFINKRTELDDGYVEMAERMVELAQKQHGYLGIESVREASGKGITVSYWKDMDSIRKWKQDTDHQVAQKLGKEKWYEGYQLQITKVEHGYSWMHN